MFMMKEDTRIDIGDLLIICVGHMARAPEGREEGSQEAKGPPTRGQSP